jgi:hypothetical protein
MIEWQAAVAVRIPASDWQYPIIPYSKKSLLPRVINGSIEAE